MSDEATRRRVHAACALAFCLGANALGCELVAGIDAFVPFDGDAGPDAPTDAGDAGAATNDDAAPSDDGCPSSGRGPRMARVGGFCVDATEVTVEQYDAFRRSDAGTQPSFCAWNRSYTPGETEGTPPQCFPAFATAPVTCVDFCDAFMFCLWAGKELCGAPSGGGAVFSEPTDRATSAWYAACAQPEPREAATAYPYGDTYDPRACNGVDHGTGSVTVTGGLRGCRREDAGVFDLSGNVWEWENATTPVDGGAGPASALARIRGGSLTDGRERLRCDTLEAQPRDFQQYNVGFRCCAPAR